jgi:glycosyltransferase involved in cell wall biosynthesis
MINYTIIIPHKDIPKLLERCLVSIPQREDVQVVIVDDNSDPGKVDFASFPGLNRDNTEVCFTKEGRGAGYARNIGLSHAKGKWIIFADADDFFMPRFDEALDLYKEYEIGVIYFFSTSVDSEKMTLHARHQHDKDLLTKIRQTNDWDLAFLLHHPWGKIIKHSLIKQHGIVFQETQYGNDVLFSMRLAAVETEGMISDYELYCVTFREGSLDTDYTINALCVRLFVMCDAAVFMKKIKKDNKYQSCEVNDFLRMIRRRSRKVALSLIPRIIINYGFGFFFEQIRITYQRKKGDNPIMPK